MLSLLTTLAAALTAVAAQASDASLVSELITATSQVERISLLADSDFVFDFLNGSRGNAQGGFAIGATSANFPALLTGNGAMTVGVLGPCGANSPHTHPRATEIQIVVKGGPIYTEMSMENGARLVKNNVSLGEATVFPKGSMHFQQNMACETTVFVASFDNYDPGTESFAQTFFGLDQGVVDATLGEIGISVLDSIKLPTNFILGAQECLDRCSINRTSFNFSSTFADYAIFTDSITTPGSPAAKPALAAVAGSSSTSGSMDVPFDQNPLKGTVIGLGAASGALLVAVVGLIGMMCFRRSARAVPSAAARFPSDMRAARGYPYTTPYDDAEGLASPRQSADRKA